MPYYSQSLITVVYGLVSFLQFASAAYDPGTNEAITAFDSCKGINDTNLSASGSVSQPGLRSSQNHNWTWHTGLSAGDEPTQYFWVDTTGSDDLNSPHLPFNACISLVSGFNSIPYSDWLKDDGNCETALGKDCIDAIRSSAWSSSGSSCKSLLNIPPPPECSKLSTHDYSSYTTGMDSLLARIPSSSQLTKLQHWATKLRTVQAMKRAVTRTTTPVERVLSFSVSAFETPV
jgi:hypothetical protein